MEIKCQHKKEEKIQPENIHMMDSRWFKEQYKSFGSQHRWCKLLMVMIPNR